MRTNLQIALRFLLAKKRSMAMSLAGIAFGVGFIVLTQAVTSGFRDFFVRTILGTDGAIRVEDKFQATTVNIPVEGNGAEAKGPVAAITVESERRYQEGIAEPRLLRESLGRFPEITGMSEVVRGSVLIQSATREDNAQVIGIEVDDHTAVSNLAEQIVLGELGAFRDSPSGILVGSALAERLRISPGNSVLLTYAGQSTRYKVAAIYETGVREIDRVRIFLHLSEARTLLKRPYGASFLQLALKDASRAPEIARQIELVASHRATSWQQREKVWLDVFLFFRIAAAIMVSTIIIVSGLGMFNTLAMIVMEKTKDIAILRSMGFTRGDIASVFMLQGLLVLLMGVASGWALGVASTYVVSSVPISVRGIFSTDHVVVAWSFEHYLAAAAAATVVVFVASWLPARRAARLEPAAIIRGASQ
ncbi:MAG: ABC transporter permease [Nibricoccus sp.]